MRLAYSAFYGLQQTHFDGCGFAVRAMRADPDRIVGRHVHEGAHAIAVLGGKYLSLASPEAPLGTMDIVYNPHGVEHADSFDDGSGAFLAISFDPVKFPGRAGEAPLPSTLRKPAAIAAIAGIWSQLASSAGAMPAVLEMNVLALAACAEPVQPRLGNAIPPRWALAARDRLASAATSLSVVDLAGQEGMHPVAFSRAFRRYFGKPPLEFAMESRLSNAAQDLARSRRPIAEIGLRWGFYDQAHFNRQFRGLYGTAPGAFRRIFQS